MDSNVTCLPFVSVLMPVYNGEKYLAEAIESILKQTYLNFEFIIINDGSTDKSESIINSFNDHRIHLINNENNIKLIASLNKGIELCKGKYIVRMDADDISLPNRISILVNFMEINTAVGVCGSYYKIIGDAERIVKYPVSHDEIKTSLLFYNPICHPTTIWRSDVIKKNAILFNANYLHAEEYKFWVQIINYAQLSNIPEVQLLYREHPHQVSNVYKDVQYQTSKIIRTELLKNVVSDLSIQETETWEEVILKSDNFFNPSLVVFLLKKVMDGNFKKNFYNHPVLIRKLSKIWKNAILECPSLPIRDYVGIILSSHAQAYHWTLKQKIAVFLKILK